MQNWLKLFFISLLCIPLQVIAADGENGMQLHETGCTRCHGSEMYTRPDRRVNSLEKLQKQVRQCVLMAELPWFDEEIDDVTEYLNVYFYQFGMK